MTDLVDVGVLGTLRENYMLDVETIRVGMGWNVFYFEFDTPTLEVKESAAKVFGFLEEVAWVSDAANGQLPVLFAGSLLGDFAIDILYLSTTLWLFIEFLSKKNKEARSTYGDRCGILCFVAG